MEDLARDAAGSRDRDSEELLRIAEPANSRYPGVRGINAFLYYVIPAFWRNRAFPQKAQAHGRNSPDHNRPRWLERIPSMETLTGRWRRSSTNRGSISNLTGSPAMENRCKSRELSASCLREVLQAARKSIRSVEGCACTRPGSDVGAGDVDEQSCDKRAVWVWLP